MPRISVSGTITAALAVLAAVAVSDGVAQARPSGSGNGTTSSAACPGTDQPISDFTRAGLRKSVRCLILAEREARGLPDLARAESLDLAAKRHVKTMIATDCLAHRCPKELDLERRLRRAGYLDGITTYRFAESTGCGTSPASMVASWMASPFDRASILDPGFDDIGVAVSDEASDELCGKGYGTFAVVFGSRM